MISSDLGIEQNPRSSRPGYLSLAVFIAIVVGGGIAIGLLTAPGDWYASLRKPVFNPPSWVFAPTWTVLYVLIAIAGWRLWSARPRGRAFATWIVQLCLNWLWSPTFFALRAPWLALVVIVALLAMIVLLIAQAWRDDRVAARLIVPYAAWVTFATLLNASIALMN